MAQAGIRKVEPAAEPRCIRWRDACCRQFQTPAHRDKLATIATSEWPGEPLIAPAATAGRTPTARRGHFLW